MSEPKTGLPNGTPQAHLGNSPSVLVENEMPPLSELKERTGNGNAEAHLKSPQEKQLSS